MITINDWRSARSFSSTLFRQADPWPMDLENKIHQIEKMYYFINSCWECVFMSHSLAYYWMAYLRIELKKWLLIFICFHKCKGRSIAFVIDRMKNVYYYLLCLHKGKNSSRRSSSSSFWPCFHCQDHIGILAWLYLYDNLPVVHLHKDHRAKGKSCWLNRRSFKEKKGRHSLNALLSR